MPLLRAVSLLPGGGIGRPGLLAIAALPLLAGDSGTAVLCLIRFNALRTPMNNFCNPALT